MSKFLTYFTEKFEYTWKWIFSIIFLYNMCIIWYYKNAIFATTLQITYVKRVVFICNGPKLCFLLVGLSQVSYNDAGGDGREQKSAILQGFCCAVWLFHTKKRQSIFYMEIYHMDNWLSHFWLNLVGLNETMGNGTWSTFNKQLC